jgi:hypothetical protein
MCGGCANGQQRTALSVFWQLTDAAMTLLPQLRRTACDVKKTLYEVCDGVLPAKRAATRRRLIERISRTSGFPIRPRRHRRPRLFLFENYLDFIAETRSNVSAAAASPQMLSSWLPSTLADKARDESIQYNSPSMNAAATAVATAA